MLEAGRDDIDPRGVNAAMPKDVCQLGNVLFDPVKSTRKQVPKVMGKYLLRIHPRLHAKPLHLPPNVRAAYGLSVPGNEDCA